MQRTVSLSRRYFVKMAGALLVTLTGTSALGGCASQTMDPVKDTDGQAGSDEAESRVQEESVGTTDAGTGAGNVLVAYFSYPEMTEASDPDNLEPEEENSTVVKDGKIYGNNEYVANIIARETGADTFRILTTRTYPTDHQELIAQAKDEMNAGDRPALAEPIPDLSGYDTVFIGYPIWWGDLPPVMMSFLEQAELADKKVYLFNTHGGSGNAGTKETIKGILSDSEVSDDNLVISRDVVADSESDVVDWVHGLRL